MIDFVEYLRAKLNTLSDSTYSIGVYDEVNYNFENPEDIVFIFSGNAYVQSDYSKKVYTQTFGLSVYTEKDGFEYASNLALELFKSINNTTEIISAYSTRIEIQSPVVLNVYGALQNGLTNTLQMTGVLHLAHVIELATDIRYQFDGIQFYPINPIVSVNVVSNTENEGGLGVTHPNYYTFEVNFSIWDDDSRVADILKGELALSNTTHSYKEYRGAVYTMSDTLHNYSLSSTGNWCRALAIGSQYGTAIQNNTGSSVTFSLEEANDIQPVVYWGATKQTGTSVSIYNNYYLEFLGKEPVLGTSKYIFYFKICTTTVSQYFVYQTGLKTIVTHATDTQSGFSTFNVKMVK